MVNGKQIHLEKMKKKCSEKGGVPKLNKVKSHIRSSCSKPKKTSTRKKAPPLAIMPKPPLRSSSSDLDKLSLKELRKIAQKRGNIKYINKYSKPQLLEKLKN